MTDLTPGLDARWNHVVQELHEAEKKAGRSAGDVTLLAVGKTFSAEALFECAKLGARAFGENYAQEGCSKVDWFREHHPELALEWHFIGPLQANKTRGVAERFDWVQSIDREKIARRLSEQRPEDLPPLNLLIEVNIEVGREARCARIARRGNRKASPRAAARPDGDSGACGDL